MGEEKRVTNCPWCEEGISLSVVKVKRYNNNYRTVIERRCPKCSQVLAAYPEDEGDFLPSIRRF